MKRLTILLLFALLPVMGTINSTMEWDVRSTGNATNGGGYDASVAAPGTDYSQQDAAQITYTDLVIGATTTQLTSALNAFGATHPGNVINITSGTGCTTGWYEVVSVSGVTATMDRSVGTAASTCAGKLGGAFVKPADAIAITVHGNTVHIKTGTYTVTSALSPNSGGDRIRIAGFASTHNDGGSRPTITTATNSINLFTTAGSAIIYFDNIIFSNTAGTPGYGIDATSGLGLALWIKGCKFSGFSIAIRGNYQAEWSWQNMVVEDSEITSSTTRGMETSYGLVMRYCWIHNNTGDGVRFSLGGSGQAAANVLYRNVFSNNTGAGVYNDISFKLTLQIINNVFYTNGDSGYKDPTSVMNPQSDMFNHATMLALENNIFYGNTGYGVNLKSGTKMGSSFTNRNNAYGGNTTAARNNLTAGTADVALSGDPFTNAAGGDFSLDSTAGEGAACAAVGYPTTYAAGLSTTSTPNIGITESSSGGGGGSSGTRGCASAWLLRDGTGLRTIDAAR